MRKLLIGTAGWTYQDWTGSFYPNKQSKNFDWLEFYSQYFNVVEVNSSYYTYLVPKIVEGWINKVEGKEDFLFTIKLHQDFTHKRHFDEQQIKSVKYNLDKLQKAYRLGGLLIQFPYSFSLNKENANHVRDLIDIFSEYDKIIEIRHKSWLIERFFNFLSSNKSTLCIIDQPLLGKAVEFNPLVIGETLYVRFHGRNEKAWKKSIENFGKNRTNEQRNERYDYLYSPGELAEIERKIREVFNAINKIYLILNNHPKGNAIAYAFELLHRLSNGMKINVPETTLTAYPRLSKISLS